MLGAEVSLRTRLRLATDDVHQRLHQHPGFAAVKDGTISRADYTRLLVRLSGFYRAFEDATSLSNERTQWLAQDLKTIAGPRGLSDASSPRPTMPELGSNERVLGALYVVEGSALGGRTLARGLDKLLGCGELDGRRFFGGHGPDTGSAWRDFLGRLELVSTAAETSAAAVDAAVETFLVFETWLAGWRTADVG